VLERNPGGDGHLVGRRASYCDLSLFQLVAGLRYAFPHMMTRLEPNFPRIGNLHDRIRGPATSDSVSEFAKAYRVQ
jgi:glutathione S-transferase